MADVDECTDGSSRCPSNTLCTNIIGSYVCRCLKGYTDKTGKCEGTCCVVCIRCPGVIDIISEKHYLLYKDILFRTKLFWRTFFLSYYVFVCVFQILMNVQQTRMTVVKTLSVPISKAHTCVDV